MSRLTPTQGWQSRVGSALLIVLVTAVVARVVWSLLAPLVPVLTVLALLLGLAMLLFRRRH